MLLSVISIGSLAFSFDPNVPHSHQGIIPPIQSAPDAVILSASDIESLIQGEVLLRTNQGKDSGRAVAVQYIEADINRVWDVILDYSQYPSRVSNVKSCEVYKRSGETRYVGMVSSIMGFSVGVYTVNTIQRSQGYMAWTLDYSRTSDVHDMIGYWRLEKIQDSPPITKLEYATEIQMKGVPSFVASYLSQGALKEGTQWVKKYAEQ